jgi:hypothetical protein
LGWRPRSNHRDHIASGCNTLWSSSPDPEMMCCLYQITKE